MFLSATGPAKRLRMMIRTSRNINGVPGGQRSNSRLVVGQNRQAKVTALQKASRKLNNADSTCPAPFVTDTWKDKKNGTRA
jgi:hypothetical protein